MPTNFLNYHATVYGSYDLDNFSFPTDSLSKYSLLDFSATR